MCVSKALKQIAPTVVTLENITIFFILYVIILILKMTAMFLSRLCPNVYLDVIVRFCNLGLQSITVHTYIYVCNHILIDVPDQFCFSIG